MRSFGDRYSLELEVTSATFPPTVSRRRAGIAAAALAGALALTGCSSGDGDAGSESVPTTASASADTGGGAGGSTTTASGELQGSWLATTDGKAVALVITDKTAGLFGTGGTVCSGTAGKESGKQVIHLECTGGDAKKNVRSTGTVDSVGKTSLKVTWEGGLGAETFTRAEGGTLPSWLPTASPGS